jgi:hypothetical protein
MQYPRTPRVGTDLQPRKRRISSLQFLRIKIILLIYYLFIRKIKGQYPSQQIDHSQKMAAMRPKLSQAALCKMNSRLWSII